MPSLAKTSMLAGQHSTERKLALANANSDLSVITRIEYNLRFTKQAILVVAKSCELHSQLANEFLVNLSNPQLEKENTPVNVAYLSATSKLNDIQIRCRLIEQLFVNTLFDPEQSLAISVLDFAKDQREPITMVIDHAQALSLQVKYELCQLVHLAKKSKYKINVVLFGLNEAAQQLAINKSLVKGKLVVIDAETGQVISLDDKSITPQKDSFSLTKIQKLSLLITSILLIAGLSWSFFLIPEAVDKNALMTTNTNNQMVLPITPNDEKPVGDTIVPPMKKKQKSDFKQVVESEAQASGIEINNAIINSIVSTDITQEPAEVTDVMAALVLNNDSLVVPVEEAIENPVKAPAVALNDGHAKLTGIDHSYYEKMAEKNTEGYVIQVAGFSDIKLWQRYIKNNKSERLFSYQRLLSGSGFIVVTSRVYPSKIAAQTAISNLSDSATERKPWLKPISSVIKEINTFQ